MDNPTMKISLAGLDEKDAAHPLSPMQYKVESAVFNGPFDLLLSLIRDGKIALHEVVLSEITDKYLQKLRYSISEINIVAAAEFLVMAAYLVEMKSRLLLPIEHDSAQEELSQIEGNLADRLSEYTALKNMAQTLTERKELFQKIFSRGHFGGDASAEMKKVYLMDVSLEELVTAFQNIWKDVELKEEPQEIQAEVITVEEKVSEILELLKFNDGEVGFEKLFSRWIKIEIIVTFLAILELVRQKLIRVVQGEVFGGIRILLCLTKPN